MKILFTRFPLESAFGGAEIQTLSLMQGLIARGHAVSFAGSCPILLAKCREAGIPTVASHIGAPPVTGWGAISFVWRKVGMRKKLQALLAQYTDLDAIVMLSLSEKLLLTDIAQAQGIKVVWLEHDRIGRWLTGNPWLKTLLGQSNKATTVAVSELSRNMYIAMGWDANKVIAVANGIDEKRVMVSPSNHDALGATLRRTQGDTSLHLGCIARLSYEKGIDLLIRAMADLPPKITLEIVGKGKEQQALQFLIDRLHLANRVHITPPIPDLTAVYERIDALLLPSRDNDPFGLVAAEAMLLGVPVVVTDACGIAGYLTDGKDAIIAKANSVSALEDAIKRMLDVEDRMALSTEGQKTAKEKFTVGRMVDEYEKVLKK